MRSILLKYMEQYLGLGKEGAGLWYHIFGAWCYITPLAGGIISDSKWGRYKTIKNLSFIYIIGTICITISANPLWWFEDPGRAVHFQFCMLGLFLIGLGAGGIKPCVAAFGADQFGAYQDKAKTEYFKYFYMIINIGALVSSSITPVMKSWDCFELSKDALAVKELYKNAGFEERKTEDMSLAFDSCQLKAYGLSAVLMTIALVTFLVPPMLAYRLRSNGNEDKAKAVDYKYTPVNKDENVILSATKCYISAVRNFLSNKKSKNIVQLSYESEDQFEARRTEEGWMMHSDHPSARFRRSCNRLSSIFKLFIPITIFWFLFEQIGSVLVFQATKLDSWVNLPILGHYYVFSDQVEALNCIYIIILIPVLNLITPFIDSAIYKNNSANIKRKCLDFMFLGLIISAVQSWYTLNLQYTINTELTQEDLGKHQTQFQFIYQSKLSTSLLNSKNIPQLDYTSQFKSKTNGHRIFRTANLVNDKNSNLTIPMKDIFRPEQTAINSTLYENVTLEIAPVESEFSFYYLYCSETSCDYETIDGSYSDQQLRGPVVVHVPESFEEFNGLNRVELDKFDWSELGNKIPAMKKSLKPKSAGETDEEFAKRETQWNHQQTNIQTILNEFPSLEYKNGIRYILSEYVAEVDDAWMANLKYVKNSYLISKSKNYKLTQLINYRVVSVSQTLMQYFLSTLAEVLISTTCLEFTYTQAPKDFKTTCTALYYLTIAVAHFMGAILNHLGLPNTSSMFFSMSISIAAAVVFKLIAVTFEIMDENEIQWLDREDVDEESLGNEESGDFDNFNPLEGLEGTEKTAFLQLSEEDTQIPRKFKS